MLAAPRIKLTSPPILALVRQVAFNHVRSVATTEMLNETDINDHVEHCVRTMATWPESLTIQYLLRDLEPEDFYRT